MDRKRYAGTIKLIDIVFVIMMVTTMLGVNYLYIRPAFQALFILGVIINKRQIDVFSFTVFMGRLLFLIWCMTSVYWALFPDVSFKYLIPVFQVTFLLPAFLCYAGRSSGQRFELAVKVFILCTIILCIYVFIKYPLPQVLQGKVVLEDRERITARGINANQLGVCCSYSVLILFASIKKIEAQKMIAIVVPMLIVAGLTGSRKALMTLIIGLVLEAVWIPEKKRNKVLLFLVTVFLVAAMFWLIYHFNAFYRILGKRVDAFFDYVMGGTGDKSISSRGYMIGYAMDLFRQKPLTGIGLHNFKSVNRYGVYAHNNYVEMLSCLGLPGFLLYYECFFHAMFLSARNIWTKRLKAGLPQILLICILANEYATVSYTNEVMQLIFGVSMCYILLQARETRTVNASLKDDHRGESSYVKPVNDHISALY